MSRAVTLRTSQVKDVWVQGSKGRQTRQDQAGSAATARWRVPEWLWW
ncbi:hypothetical protein [uncultured Actinomyces sp.]|nr:hypothetical protein [uncultured Actinomyces sp.]